MIEFFAGAVRPSGAGGGGPVLSPWVLGALVSGVIGCGAPGGSVRAEQTVNVTTSEVSATPTSPGADATTAETTRVPTGFTTLDQLAGGVVNPGCFAWSEAQSSLACLVLTLEIQGGGWVGLSVVGDAPQQFALYATEPEGYFVYDLEAFDELDRAALCSAAAYLQEHGFTEWASSSPQVLGEYGVATLGGVTLSRRREMVSHGGENEPPRYQEDVQLGCGGAAVPLELDGGTFGNSLGTVEMTVFELPSGDALLFGQGSWGEEGNYGRWADVMLVDRAACER